MLLWNIIFKKVTLRTEDVVLYHGDDFIQEAELLKGEKTEA